MAVEARPGKKGMSYRVKWRVGGDGVWWSRTFHDEAVAYAYNDSLRAAGWPQPDQIRAEVEAMDGADQPAAVRRVLASRLRWCSFPGCGFSGLQVSVEDHMLTAHAPLSRKPKGRTV